MKNIRIAFYRKQKGDWFGSLITGWTSLFSPHMPPYCHVEIGIPIDGKFIWYSSASRNSDGTTGTRFIKEEDLFKNRNRWDIYEVAPIRSGPDMLNTAIDECGKRYDWPGLFGFILPLMGINKLTKWYCSEICYYIDYEKWRKQISPKDYFKKIKPRIVKLLCPNLPYQNS